MMSDELQNCYENQTMAARNISPQIFLVNSYLEYLCVMLHAQV